MQTAFTKWSPTENITVLVSSPVARSLQSEYATKLLGGIGGEQVGFLETSPLSGARLRLQMMGGEFCGNATMTAGAYLARSENLPVGAQADYLIDVSGTFQPVPCRIERISDAWRGTVCMPLPECLERISLQTDAGTVALPLVRLPGIAHIVAPVETGLNCAQIERRIRSWNDVVRADALGVLLYDEARQSIRPIVYVPATDTACWERGCGSGTAALGAWQAHRRQSPFSVSIRQPGGEIAVRAEANASRVASLSITGVVRLIAEGVAYL